MSGSEVEPRNKVLHVLTLSGRNGEYGGPVRVARELCLELEKRDYATHIFSGARVGSEPIQMAGLDESFVLVKPISKKLPVSSLWSWHLIKPLSKLIKSSDLVHIHFARDLIPFSAALLSIIYRKPFVTQTHGMIISDGRLSTRVLDFILTRPLINRSKSNFVLTEIELNAISRLKIKSQAKILPNGINVSSPNKSKSNQKKRVIFCSRLEKRKGVGKFIELANSFKDSGMDFEIYGPDGGELELVQSEITSRKLDGILKYKGALQAQQVQKVLFETDLLVLPSKDEPFPMVILEALAVGTPVLIMPSCGFAKELEYFESNFVSPTEDFTGLRTAFQKIVNDNFQSKNRSEIIDYCRKNFGITTVVDRLTQTYEKFI
jgi:glycosyltransferase involved in cell wall biosynthesis